MSARLALLACTWLLASNGAVPSFVPAVAADASPLPPAPVAAAVPAPVRPQSAPPPLAARDQPPDDWRWMSKPPSAVAR